MAESIPVGCLVQVIGLPPGLQRMPPETQAAFQAALGGQFVVVAHGPYGHLELELGRELDRRLGGFMNTVWIEPELVRRIYGADGGARCK